MIKLLNHKLWWCIFVQHHKPPIPFDADPRTGDQTTCLRCGNKIFLGQDGYWQLAKDN